MRDIVSRVLNGNYIPAQGHLDFSTARVEIGVSCDCDYEGTFNITSSNGGRVEGVVFSSDTRMECLNTELTGNSTEVAYHFHGDLSGPGDIIEGFFGIVSSYGEYTIPFIVKVEPGELSSCRGPIKNLFSFTNLAKTDWKEAVGLFYDPGFSKILLGSDEQFISIYEALSTSPGNEQNLEEFLISTGRKNVVTFSGNRKVFDTAITAGELSEKVIEREVEIVRNGWGYTDISVETDSDFMFTEMDRLTDDDFIGNICNIKLFFDLSKCGKGRHEGKLILRTNFTVLEIPVVIRGRTEIISAKMNRSKMRLTAKLTDDYIKHGLGLISDEEWFRESASNVEQLAELKGNAVFVKLFKARLLCLENRNNEASWLVDQAAEMIEHEQKEGNLSQLETYEAYAYHWLVAANVKPEREFVKMAAGKVETLYRKYPDSWQMGIIAISLPTSYAANSYTKWALLENLYDRGCRSAALYFEGVKIINENPAILKKLTSHAVQTIYFGVKNNAFNPRSIEYIIDLYAGESDFKYVNLRTLECLYEIKPDNRVLGTLCSFLVRHNIRVPRAAKWYRLAIEKELKITNLYEEFIQSIDIEADEDIPLVVLMYFGYRNNLSEERLAYYYYYLIRHKEEFRDLYENSLQNMDFFAVGQIAKSRISRHLAVVYEEVLRPELLSRQQAIGFAKIVFSKHLTCDSKKSGRVFVYQKGCLEPLEYELKEGEAYITSFGASLIVLEDKQGNRYIDSVKCSLEDMLPVARYLNSITELVWDNERLNLYLLGSGNNSVTVTRENVDRFMQLATSKIIRPEVRQKMLVECFEYYMIRENNEMAEKIYRMLDKDMLTARQRCTMLPFLSRIGQAGTAVNWIERYGPYFAGEDNIKKFLERELLPRETTAPAKKDPLITQCAMYVFRKGNPGTLITAYLAQNYRGLIREMIEIRRALCKYEMPTGAIDKHILIQHMYTFTYVPEISDISREYVAANPDNDTSLAVIYVASYNYLTGNGVISSALMRDIADFYMHGKQISQPVKLAFLKYYADNPSELNETLTGLVVEFLRDEIDERIYLGFYRKFLRTEAFDDPILKKKLERVTGELKDRTIVDCASEPGNPPRIHYMISEDGKNGQYAEGPMREACAGMCFKDFILFSGETLKYYITEGDDEDAPLLDSGDISIAGRAPGRNDSKYDMINDLIMSNEAGDYENFERLLKEYYRKEFISGELFKLI